MQQQGDMIDRGWQGSILPEAVDELEKKGNPNKEETLPKMFDPEAKLTPSKKKDPDLGEEDVDESAGSK